MSILSHCKEEVANPVVNPSFLVLPNSLRAPCIYSGQMYMWPILACVFLMWVGGWVSGKRSFALSFGICRSLFGTGVLFCRPRKWVAFSRFQHGGSCGRISVQSRTSVRLCSTGLRLATQGAAEVLCCSGLRVQQRSLESGVCNRHTPTTSVPRRGRFFNVRAKHSSSCLWGISRSNCEYFARTKCSRKSSWSVSGSNKLRQYR